MINEMNSKTKGSESKELSRRTSIVDGFQADDFFFDSHNGDSPIRNSSFHSNSFEKEDWTTISRKKISFGVNLNDGRQSPKMQGSK